MLETAYDDWLNSMGCRLSRFISMLPDGIMQIFVKRSFCPSTVTLMNVQHVVVIICTDCACYDAARTITGIYTAKVQSCTLGISLMIRIQRLIFAHAGGKLVRQFCVAQFSNGLRRRLRPYRRVRFSRETLSTQSGH